MAPIRLLALEPPCAMGAALKRKRKKKKLRLRSSLVAQLVKDPAMSLLGVDLIPGPGVPHAC